MNCLLNQKECKMEVQLISTSGCNGLFSGRNSRRIKTVYIYWKVAFNWVRPFLCPKLSQIIIKASSPSFFVIIQQLYLQILVLISYYFNVSHKFPTFKMNLGFLIHIISMKNRYLNAILAFLLVSTSYPVIAQNKLVFDKYHNYQEVQADLKKLAATKPEKTKLLTIAQSREERM